MATLFKPLDVQVDGDGVPMAGAKLYFYTTGTSTPQDTFSDDDLDPAHVNTNPVVADANGLWGPIYLGATDYKVILKTAAGVTVKTLDPLLVNPQAASLTSQMDSAFGSTQYLILQRGASTWGGITPKAFLDNKFGSTQGTLVYRGASDWSALAAPAALSYLSHAGTGNNPAWTANKRAYFYGTVSGGVLTSHKSSGLTVARSAQGQFECTLSPALSDAYYRVNATTAMTLSAGAGQAPSASEDTAAGTRSTTKFYLITRDDTVGTQDPDAISIEVFP